MSDETHDPDDIDREIAELTNTPAVPDSMQTRMAPIGTIRRYWRNPRKKQNIEKLAAVLRRFGWRQPIVIDAENTIIVGDTRYLAAQANHDTHVPVWIAKDLSPAQVHSYRIADNRIAEESEWDEDALARELELLLTMGISEAELGEATGFDEKELAGYLAGADAPGGIEPVDVHPFPPYTWVLVGIPTNRFVEIAEAIESIQLVPDLFVEVTANDERP